MAENDDVVIRVGLQGQQETSRGLKTVAGDERAVGAAAEQAGAKARAMGAGLATAGKNAGAGARDMLRLGYGARYAGAGLVGLGIAGAKWGIGFNNQVEQARMRFRLFTSDVDGLTKAVSVIDKSSQFNFADLANSAAMLGNSNIKDIPRVLQGAANAAAASGRGTQALDSIVIALSQIQQKGRLSQEELNQLAEAGAPQVMNTISKAYGLTAKQLGNVGAQGLDATKAIEALTTEWTSGRMADAAKRQLSTVGGQWSLFTGNAQKVAGALTLGVTGDLERNLLPAANRAADAINAIFNPKGPDAGLSNAQKYRKAREVIVRELGPVWTDLKHEIDKADIPRHLADAVDAALPKILEAMGKGGVHAAEAFGKGWLHAGFWGKFAGGAVLLHLLGLDRTALQALGKGIAGGKGAGGALGKLAGKASPVPVWVVNGPGGSPFPGSKTVKDVVKTVGPAIASRALPLGLGVGGAAAFGGIAALALTHNENFPTKGPGASSPSNPAGHVPFIGGGLERVAVDVHPQPINLDGRVLSISQGQAAARRVARAG